MKILVVFTGGTIGSCYNDGVISPDSSTRYKLIEMYKQNEVMLNSMRSLLTRYSAKT